MYNQQQYQQNMQQFMPMAQALRQAMRGMGTDERAIINIAAQHNFLEREQIALAFAAMYGVDLYQELKSELSNNLEKLIVSVFRNRYDMWAIAIGNALNDTAVKEIRLIGLVLLMSDYDIPLVAQAYQRIFNSDLLHQLGDVLNNHGSDWARLLRGWIRGNNVTQFNPQQGAQMLYTAAKGAGTDEGTFVQIMCTATPESYRQITAAFPQMFGQQLEDIIKREFTGSSEDAFLIAHAYLNNPADSVALSLNFAMKGAGTDDDMLIYITALFSDYFKGPMIRSAFTKYGDITKTFKRELTGKYEDAMLAIWALQ